MTSPEAGVTTHERKIGVSKPEETFRRERDGYRPDPRDAGATTLRTTASGTQGTMAATSTPPNKSASTPRNTPMPSSPSSSPSSPAEQRGIPLPGDRGRDMQGGPEQRPSFWRRIALGRRATKTREDDADSMSPSNSAQTLSSKSLAPATSRSTPANRSQPATTDSIENRIVEPMLQALVSVESKLERSHIDLLGRSDQIEQRLSQLWDIEEQLGTLGEVQESLLQVSEQQRRLERAIISQATTLRWLVGAVFFTLGVAAFVVAAVLR
jgi:hypothetical protein